MWVVPRYQRMYEAEHRLVFNANSAITSSMYELYVCVFREASSLVEDLKGLVEELEQEQQMSLINVELVDDELARVYSCSNKAQVFISPPISCDPI